MDSLAASGGVVVFCLIGISDSHLLNELEGDSQLIHTDGFDSTKGTGAQHKWVEGWFADVCAAVSDRWVATQNHYDTTSLAFVSTTQSPLAVNQAGWIRSYVQVQIEEHLKLGIRVYHLVMTDALLKRYEGATVVLPTYESITRAMDTIYLEEEQDTLRGIERDMFTC